MYWTFISFNFNPRSPHGERQFQQLAAYIIKSFQSTLPARGATESHRHDLPDAFISIHAPRTGSDPCTLADVVRGTAISIHAPRTGSDKKGFAPGTGGHHISIHAPRTGSDRRRK